MRLRNILNPHMKEQLFLSSKLQCQKLVDKNGTRYQVQKLVPATIFITLIINVKHLQEDIYEELLKETVLYVTI